jgi:hypothetical protein
MRLAEEKENSIYLDKQFGFFELSIDPAQIADARGKLGSGEKGDRVACRSPEKLAR